MKRTILYLILMFASIASASAFVVNSIRKFYWLTGHDSATIQFIPAQGNNPIIGENGKSIVHVKFKVNQYGEVSFHINIKTPAGDEAIGTDLSKRKGIKISYQANHELILQLRQTGVHGGVHNHVILPQSENDTTVTIPFTQFKGGKAPLNLRDVAKFNFAFLKNNPEDGYAELKISDIEIK